MIIYLRGAVAEWVRELAWTGDLTVPAGSNPFYPALPVYFGGDIKFIGPSYVVSMAMGSKTSHQSSLERVTTTHSKLSPPEVRLCSRKRCSALVSEEDRRTCPSGT